jgi:hypothetical protein
MQFQLLDIQWTGFKLIYMPTGSLREQPLFTAHITPLLAGISTLLTMARLAVVGMVWSLSLGTSTTIKFLDQSHYTDLLMGLVIISTLLIMPRLDAAVSALRVLRDSFILMMFLLRGQMAIVALTTADPMAASNVSIS